MASVNERTAIDPREVERMQHLTNARQTRAQAPALRTMRRLGALAVVAGGAVHLQQYLGADYRAIPTIGPLFLLNAIGSGAIGLALLAPLERVFSGRKLDLVTAALADAGLLIALGSLVALFISESGSLFGFSESGYRTPIVIAIVAEVAALLLLAPVAAISLRRAGSERVARSPGRARGLSVG
jgi:hypothetical protein